MMWELVVGTLVLWGQLSGGAEGDMFRNLPDGEIGPHDLLSVTVYDAPELTRTVRVEADGRIRLPLLEQRLQAAGLVPAELEAAIRLALVREQVLVDPVVTVTIAEYHSRPIRVLGAVKNPVSFQAAGPVTLLDALARAGGLSPEAGPEILLSRPGGKGASEVPRLERIPVRQLLEDPGTAGNLELVGGEEIRVPEAGRVYVLGNVRRPGAFVLSPQGAGSVLQALALAEGLAPFASRRAYIYRPQAGGGYQEVPVELSRILAHRAPDVDLSANDILYIPDHTGRRITATALEKITGFGAATASGVLIWRR